MSSLLECMQQQQRPDNLPQVLSGTCLVRKSRSRCGSDGLHAVELNYDTFGERNNPAVLLVMGLTAQKVRFPVAFCQQLAAEGFFVIRFDNRDIGRSARMVKSRVHQYGAHGILAWGLVMRVLKEWGKPAFFLWLFVALRTWRRLGLRSRAGRLLSSLLLLWWARWHRTKVLYTVADMAGDALELLDALDIHRAHFVGYSMGGMISQYIAHHFPKRMRSLALVSTCSPNARLTRSPGISTPLVMGAKSGLAYMPGTPSHRRVEGTRRMWEHVSGPGQEQAQQELAEAEMVRSETNLDAVVRQFLAILDYTSGDGHWPPSQPEASHIRTIVIHGLIDNLLPIIHGFDLAKRHRCKCVVLPSISHDSFPAGQGDILEELKGHLRRASSK